MTEITRDHLERDRSRQTASRVTTCVDRDLELQRVPRGSVPETERRIRQVGLEPVLEVHAFADDPETHTEDFVLLDAIVVEPEAKRNALVEVELGATGEADGRLRQAREVAHHVDLGARDTKVKPGDDFNRYVNGQWLDTYQLKDYETNYGSFNMLRDQSESQVHAIIEELQHRKDHAAGSEAQKVRDY